MVYGIDVFRHCFGVFEVGRVLQTDGKSVDLLVRPQDLPSDRCHQR